MRPFNASVRAGILLSVTAAVQAQPCTPDWIPTFESGDLHGPVRAFTIFDRDGSGPEKPSLFALETFGSAFAGLIVEPTLRRPVQRWTGRHWEPVGGDELTGTGSATVRGSLAVYDSDADGPLPPSLYASSRSLQITRDGRTSHGIARFDGQAWTHVAEGFTSGHTRILDLQVFDEDGPGPLAPALFAAADNLGFDGGFHDVLRLRGDAWSTVGASVLNGAVADLMVWDSDGPGPISERLLAAGLFDNSADAPPGPSFLAVWNGAQWESIGAGVSGRPGPGLGLAVFDPDASGPAPPELYVAAADNPIGGTLRGLVSWNGQHWTHHGVIATFVGFGAAQINWGRMSVHDDDGAGPVPPALYVAGVPQSVPSGGRVSRWSGSEWTVPWNDPFAPYQGGPQYPAVFGAGPFIEAFASFDLDGDGPQPATLIMGGDFGAAVQPPAVTNESGTACMVEQLSGNFVIGWKGDQWQPLGSGLSSPHAYYNGMRAESMTVFDPDIAGPVPESLYVHGSFNTAGVLPIPIDPLTCQHDHANARWTPSGWSRAGLDHEYDLLLSPRMSIVSSSADFDPDGPGPIPATKHIAGSFDQIDSAPNVGPLARWNPSLNSGAGGWENFGARDGGTAVFALQPFDPDGPGPAPQALIAAGDFVSIYLNESSASGAVVAWDGAAWTTTSFVAGGAAATDLTLFDRDGAGSIPAYLIAAGDFVQPTSLGNAKDIAQYDGLDWTPLGGGSFTGSADGSATRVNALAVYNNELYAAGNFLQWTDGVTPIPARGLARWDGVQWSAIIPNLDNPVAPGISITSPLINDLALFDPDAAGPMPPSIFVAGAFTVPGGTSQGVARWDGTRWNPLGAGLSFSPYSVIVFSPVASDLEIVDDDGQGPTPPALFIAGTFLKAGDYSSWALAKWGCTQSAAPTPCPGDANADLSVNFADITAVLTFWLSSGPEGDANHDGSVNFADITEVLTFFSVPCP